MPTTSRLTEAEQRLVAELEQHPGWPVLTGALMDIQQNEARHLAGELLRGEQHEYPSTKDLAYRRGYFEGMRFLINFPAKQAKAIKRGEA